jgi:hypothetical protein
MKFSKISISDDLYDISGLVDLSSEQVISARKDFTGGVGFAGDLDLVDGNYRQTALKEVKVGEETVLSSGRVYNYSPKNSFIQAEEAFSGSKVWESYGVACTGYKGFCILEMNPTTKIVKLSAEPDNAAARADDLSDIMYTIEHQDCGWSYIYGGEDTNGKEVAPNRVSVVAILDDMFALSDDFIVISCSPQNVLTQVPTTGDPDPKKVWEDGDENAFYMVPDQKTETRMLISADNGAHMWGKGEYGMGKSILGNQLIGSFNGNHAEGGSVKAIGKYSHAEGRMSIAEGRYSHVEGSGCNARRIYSHAEGQNTKAIGLAAHAEGAFTEAYNK